MGKREWTGDLTGKSETVPEKNEGPAKAGHRDLVVTPVYIVVRIFSNRTQWLRKKRHTFFNWLRVRTFPGEVKDKKEMLKVLIRIVLTVDHSLQGSPNLVFHQNYMGHLKNWIPGPQIN